MIPKRVAYAEQLKDPRWQQVRLEILSRDGWTCQICGDHPSTLHVHHRDYLPDTAPWDYPRHWLVTLCEACHHTETVDRRWAEEAMVKTLRRLGLYTHQRAALACTLEVWDAYENGRSRAYARRRCVYSGSAHVGAAA
ncbi:MAG: hypothetical protein M3361_18805 [Candidatus Tectomicrobia bacterium]|nr:hypothetical protein [Candidatus Tectomicrobia bacterium]